MTMYKKEYAMCILQDGKVLPESNGAVSLPFGTEYQIRLRNKSRIRSVADIHIDGESAAKGIVLDPDGYVDIERFVKDLYQGSKFQLARLSDPGVAQPGESQNGLVEIRFYKEKPAPVMTTTEHYHVNHHGTCRCPNWDNRKWNNDIQYGSSLRSSKGIRAQSRNLNQIGEAADVSYSADVSSFGLDSSTLAMDQEAVSASVDGAPEAAATVKGSLSNQQFTSISMDIDTSKCVTLSLKLMGVTRVINQCPCGFTRSAEKFCPDCGTVLAVGI